MHHITVITGHNTLQDKHGDLYKIISEIEYRLKDRDITIELTKEAKDYIINNSYDEAFGARPIKRFVSDNLETLLAMKLINDEIKDNSHLIVDVDNNKLIIKAN